MKSRDGMHTQSLTWEGPWLTSVVAFGALHEKPSKTQRDNTRQDFLEACFQLRQSRTCGFPSLPYGPLISGMERCSFPLLRGDYSSSFLSANFRTAPTFWKADSSFSPTPTTLIPESSGRGLFPLPPFLHVTAITDLLWETSSEPLASFFSLHTEARTLHVLKQFSRTISAQSRFDGLGKEESSTYFLVEMETSAQSKPMMMTWRSGVGFRLLLPPSGPLGGLQ